MSRSVAATAFAWDALTLYGDPVAGSDHVRVRLTQHELARRCRCSPSTVSWYLRRLGTAVVTRRGGIVFDRGALARLDADAAPLPSSTALVERQLLQAHARPTAEGIELLAGDLDNPTPASLQELADTLGINRSSTHRHLSTLEQAGHLLRRGRRLYVLSPQVPAPKEPTVDEPASIDVDAAPPALGPITPQQIMQLLERVTDLLGLIARMADQLLDTSQVTTAGPPDPRSLSAQTANDAELRAAAAADRVRGFSSEVDLIDRNDPQITSDHPPVHAKSSRPATDMHAEVPRIAEEDWGLQQLPQLLAPLLEECALRQLPGVSDEQRVAQSLRPYSAQQITAAARQMAADLRSGAPMRSPIAILLRKAEAGDPYYFRAPSKPVPPPPAPVLLGAPHEPVIDHVAVAAIAAMTGDELASLDQAVRSRVRALLGPARTASIENVLESEEGLAHWRATVWREQAPATAEGGA